MKKIKILQFPIAGSKGGITRYILQNWNFIDKTKFQFDFATMSPSLDFAELLEKEECKIYYLSCYAEANREKFKEEFRAILLNGNYDIVHLHTKQWKSFLVEQIAKELGVKRIIIHSHNTGIDTLDNEKREKEQKLHFQVRDSLDESIATDFWACSKLAADFLFGNKISKEKIKIMNNAINISKFIFNSEIRQKYRKALGIENDFVIGNVGRFVYQKNQEFLLEVIKKINQVKKNCKLLLIGTGEKKLEYEQYAKQNGIENLVIFLGQRNDVHSLLQAMDVFVLPSRFEGLPIAAIEAQTAGLKCICNDTITEEVKITENLELIPLRVELWVDEILKIMNLAEKGVYKRNDMSQVVTDSGYNIVSQIHIIEQYYEMVPTGE